MNSKAFIFISATLCALVLVFYWFSFREAGGHILPPKMKSSVAQGVPSSIPVSTEQPQVPAQRTNEDEVVNLADLQQIIKEGFGKGAVKATIAMEAFLKTWNPIGRSAQEVKATLGKPSVEKPDSIIYMFDGGAFGAIFEFVLRDGKVIELKRPPSE